MKNKRVEKELKKEYGSLIGVILNIALVIAALIFTVSLFGMISELRRVYQNDRGSSSLSYYLEDGDFGNMTSSYLTRNTSVAPISDDVKYCYDIAEYAHTAFMKRIYEGRDDNTRAAKCDARMQELRDMLSEYGVAADAVDEELKGF